MYRRIFQYLGSVLIAIPLTAAISSASSPAYQLRLIQDGFENPVLVTDANNGLNHLYVVEKTGRIYVFDPSNEHKHLYLDASSLITTRGNEQGLLSVAFHPDFKTNGYLFIFYTARNGDNTLARLTANPPTTRQINLDSLEVLLAVDDPASNHNGGMLAFGQDGYLYLGIGDGGRGGDPWNNAQDLDTLLGKMLRVDVDQPSGYSIPKDNPFNSVEKARPEIWAYGLRNPWRHSFDASTGDLWIADVGQNQWEEINWQPAGSKGGQNYGWRLMEGMHCYKPRKNCRHDTLVLPVAEYAHSDGCSVTGGYVYRGKSLVDLEGQYLFGDYCTGTIWTLDKDDDFAVTKLMDTDLNISSFGEDIDGELYVVDYRGAIYKLVK